MGHGGCVGYHSSTGEAAVVMHLVERGYDDLAPIVPDGNSPVMIRRAFQRLNQRIDRLRSLFIGMVVFNDDGIRVQNDEHAYVLTPADTTQGG